MILRRIAIFIIDSALYYAALFAMLIIRYGQNYKLALDAHLEPFTIGFILWILAGYIGGLYEVTLFRNSKEFRQVLSAVLTLQAVLLVALFYFSPALEIAPKTNLVIFMAIFSLLMYGWRYFFNALVESKTPRAAVLFLGSNRSVEELIDHIQKNSQLGYDIAVWLKDGLQNKNSRDLEQIIKEKNIGLIVIPGHIKKQARSAKIIYQNLLKGTKVVSLADFYQQIFSRISIPELEEVWFLDNLTLRRRSYQIFKRLAESLAAFILLMILLPIFLLIAMAIKITSAGPVFYIQPRVGRNEKVFNLYKFRSMYATPDKNPDAAGEIPIWSTGMQDKRVTAVGKFLRLTHLDEFPQLFNILIGNMSFVGPRPERPEFDKELERDIPFYELRYLVKPGVTGWAQINYPYGASVEDAYQKVQYDIYYITHRSPILDILIVLKTFKRFFIQAK